MAEPCDYRSRDIEAIPSGARPGGSQRLCNWSC